MSVKSTIVIFRMFLPRSCTITFGTLYSPFEQLETTNRFIKKYYDIEWILLLLNGFEISGRGKSGTFISIECWTYLHKKIVKKEVGDKKFARKGID